MKTPLRQAREDFQAASESLSITQIAFADVLKGDVQWFGRAPYRVGITRPKSASGGLAVEVWGGSVVAQRCEAFFSPRLETIACLITGHDSEHNRELLARRITLEQARAYIREQQQLS